MFYDIMSPCIIIQNMIIEDYFDTDWSIFYLNMMFIPKVDMIINKTKQFQRFLTRHK